MTDYGHELLFGSFLTPTNERPGDVVELTLLSERLGLDLATFQDHPYQPGFLDTWTLLSHVGALTSTIRLAPNVLNLPLRNPAVVARSAASLDLLTGGRVDLGLGAGAFWDAIEAMGGRRLAPADAVRGLTEAVEIIRGVWDVTERRPLRVAGEVHRVAGAKRGPAPAHPVPIWVGAYKPRMLAVTGRVADGWLPSLSYLDLTSLPAANAAIDDAAVEAGRSPADVRRLLNVTGRFTTTRGGLLVGPASQWVEELAGLVLEHGFSAFVLGGDDPRALAVYAEEVAPAVRALVASERAGRGADERAGRGADHPGVEASGPAASVTAAAPPHGGSGAGLRPTPPPAARLLEKSLLEEGTRPRRADVPADAAYTDEGRAVGQHLIDVHDMLRTELAKVRDLVAQVRAGAVQPGEARSQINAMTMRQNAWTMGAYCESYCRVVTGHHGLEDDAIFPHLRAQSPDLEPVIDRLLQEHHVIAEVLEGVDRALVAVVRRGGEEPEDYGDVQRAVDALTDTLLSHFAYEEEQLVEPLARYGFYAGQLA